MEKQSNIKLVIFDFDGTLVNLKVSWENIRKRLREQTSGYGLVENFTPILPGIERVALQLKRYKDISESKTKEELYKILDDEEIKSLSISSSIKNSKKILDFLVKKNVIFVIATRNGRKVVKEAFEKFEFPVPLAIFSRNNQCIKPDRMLLNEILESNNVDAKDCIIVGDGEVDKEFGRIKNIKTIIKKEDYHDLLEIKKIIYA